LPLPVLAGFEKSLGIRAGSPRFAGEAGTVPCAGWGLRHRECFAVRYGLRLVFYTEGSLDSIKNFAVIPCAPIYNGSPTPYGSRASLKNQLCRNLSNVPQTPACAGASPDVSLRLNLALRSPSPMLRVNSATKGENQPRSEVPTPIRWSGRASFRKPARAGYYNMRYLTIQII
jgi:hypothetical protein